jgi:hypothetical protein
MYILKTEFTDQDRFIYWTLDGEHIFKVDRTPINRLKGNDKIDRNYSRLPN